MASLSTRTIVSLSRTTVLESPVECCDTRASSEGNASPTLDTSSVDVLSIVLLRKENRLVNLSEILPHFLLALSLSPLLNYFVHFLFFEVTTFALTSLERLRYRSPKLDQYLCRFQMILSVDLRLKYWMMTSGNRGTGKVIVNHLAHQDASVFLFDKTR